MLVIGADAANPRRLLTITEPDLLYHMAVIGQSGSGKSYFIARLLEEITLRTRARVIILDPNGDFNRFHSVRERAFWEEGSFATSLRQFKAASSPVSYDDYDSFYEGWSKRRFHFVTAGHPARTQIRDRVYRAPLLLHWKFLSRSEQDFLLNIDPIVYPTIYQGITTCHHYMRDVAYDYPQGYSLKDLEEVAEDFATKRVAMAKYPEAHALGEEDWLAVRLQFRQLRKKFDRLWFRDKLKNLTRAPTDLSGYIRSGFRQPNAWQLCVVGLAALETNNVLLAADAALDRSWVSAKDAWKKVQSRITEEQGPPVVETASNAEEIPEDPSEQQTLMGITRVEFVPAL